MLNPLRQRSVARCVTRAQLRTLFAGLFTSTMALGSALDAQPVNISVAPSAQRVFWSDDLPFEDDDLYGGRLALRFGPYVELQPFYFTRDGYGVDSARAADLFGTNRATRGLDLRHYGSQVQFNLGDAAAVPFVRVGAGVLRLLPDSAPRQDRITVSAGGGLRFGVGGLNAELYAEQMRFRMDPSLLFGADSGAVGEAPTLRNMIYGVALTVPLSTADAQPASAEGLQGAAAPIEPFVGVLRYDDAFGLDDQELAGVRAGFDFSPVFGVHGFYWRGVNDDRDGPAPVAGYGGEAQFNLNSGPGISPYLITGAGRVDYRDNFRDSMDRPRSDLSTLILGAGASFHLSDRLRLNAAIRDYIMTVDDNLDELATTGDLTHNPMVTAGLTISFGGDTDGNSARRQAARRSGSQNESDRDFERRMERLLTRLEMERSNQQSSDRERAIDLERQIERELDDRNRDARGESRPSGRRGGGMGDRWVTIPVPERGEVILRYGLPTSDSLTAQLQRMELSPDSPDQNTTGGANSALLSQLQQIEMRLTRRLEALERSVGNRSPEGAEPAMPPVVVVDPTRPGRVSTPTGSASATLSRDEMPLFSRLRTTRSSDLRPYLGIGWEDDDVQFVIGARADLGAMSGNEQLRFVPELAFGLGDGTQSLLAMANAQYRFGSLAGMTDVQPYVTLGAGLYTPTLVGVNTAVGTSFRINRGNNAPLYLNLEAQGLNVYRDVRFLIGLSRSR